MSRATSLSSPTPTDQPDANRLDGVQTTTERLLAPATPGVDVKFMLTDAHRPSPPATDRYDVGEGRRIPDASLYL